MISKIVHSNAEFENLTAMMKAAGYRWISLSNAGLPAGQARATYLPDNIDLERKPPTPDTVAPAAKEPCQNGCNEFGFKDGKPCVCNGTGMKGF